MPIILDPSKNLINLKFYFIEEIKKHGNSVFTFMKNQNDFNEWKEKGFKTKEEINTLKKAQPPQIDAPGAPVQKQTYDSNKIIHEINCVFKRLTWKEQNILFSKSLRNNITVDNKTVTDFDGIKYRELKLKNCLKRWDLIDEQGQPIVLDDSNIDNLDPVVAQEFLEGFENVSEATNDEKKA